MTNVSERVFATIAEQSGKLLSDIKPESRLVDDLGMDSLDLIEAIMCLEEEFEIMISEEDAERCLSVADVITLITTKGGA